MKDKITIVIPTHNRSAILNRAIFYYSSWDCQIIICDSSPEIETLHNHRNVDHRHHLGESFSEKIYNALMGVTTPFVCLCADDDFLTIHGIIEGINWLENNADYVSVQGRYVQFRFSGKFILSVPLYHEIYGMHFNQDDSKDRVIASANAGMHQIYSLHRTEVLKNTFSVCQDIKIITFAEYTSNLVGMFFGKHIMLPVFWMARDAERYTTYNFNLNDGDVNSIVKKQNLIHFLQSKDGLRYKKNFSGLFSKITHQSSGEGESLFNKVFFEIYLRDDLKIPKPLAQLKKVPWLRSFIKSLIPQIIKDWLNSNRFPFTEEPIYKSDWESIVKVISKFKNLPIVEREI
jgi:glycosyltransferase domain-containing protein